MGVRLCLGSAARVAHRWVSTPKTTAAFHVVMVRERDRNTPRHGEEAVGGGRIQNVGFCGWE